MTPNELAAELGVSPKTLRAWLRRTFERSPVEVGQRWLLDPPTVTAAREHFRPTTSPSSPPASAGGADAPSSLESPDLFESFTAAPMLSRAEVLGVPCPVPAVAGVYGWWFRMLPADIDTDGCLHREGRTLLYTGISPRRPPASEKPPSTQTLRHRIVYHYTGNAEGSTLRKTLGVLLAGTLGIELRRIGSGNRMTFVNGEARLSEWMAQHAFVSWLPHLEPWLAEERLIATLDVPLNLDGNRRNRFHPELTERRKAAVQRARELPVLPNPSKEAS